MKDIQVLFVVETNEFVKSDDAYYIWILKNYFNEYLLPSGHNGLRIRYDFIYMSGKTNYCKKEVKSPIGNEIKAFKPNKTYVVYCFDVDNNTITNKTFLKEVKDYCNSNDYLISLANREIEEVLNVPNPNTSKHDRVIQFRKKHPKKAEYDSNIFFVPLEHVCEKRGQTNFGLVIKDIIDLEKD